MRNGPLDSRFFGKPLGVEQMIAELQAMVGEGALEIVTDAASLPAEGSFDGVRPNRSVSTLRTRGRVVGGE